MSSAQNLFGKDSVLNKMELALIPESLRFSNDDKKIFLKLKETNRTIMPDTAIKVDVWSYADPKLYSLQKKDLVQRKFVAVLNLSIHKLIQLENDHEIISSNKDQVSSDYAISFNFDNDILTYDPDGNWQGYSFNEYNWNQKLYCNVYLINLNDGSRRLLKTYERFTTCELPYFRISPDERFVLYYDHDLHGYLSYEISTGRIQNLTRTISTDWTSGDTEAAPCTFNRPNGFLTWINNDSTLFLFDRYWDIWRIGLNKNNRATNVTEGYAKRNKVRFNRIDDKSKGDKIYLHASQESAYQQGIYSLDLRNSYLRKLIMDKNNYNSITRAANAEVYLFAKENDTTPSRFYYSSNFTDLIEVGDRSFEPKLQVKNKEVIVWKTSKGIQLNGILYRPRHFDGTMKYPVIFYYYTNAAVLSFNRFETYNEQTNLSYATADVLNINFFLNNGYCVFVPNLYYVVGETCQSVCDAITSAAKCLTKFSFIDRNKMGLQGHSFGGYETDCIVSHTKIFAAACAGSGMTDLISHYGTNEEDEQGFTYAATVETGQVRLGVNLWERPDIYIKNSPIFYADRITTPLLILANHNDHRVPFQQGVELFKALRRLGKIAWLLQYDNGKHSVWGEKETRDYGLRMFQFFDHYLKGSPAPVWMTRGIPSRLKGTTHGYEYDTVIKTPGPGLLMENEDALTPQQKELLKHKTRVNEEGRIEDVMDDKNQMKKRKNQKH